MEVYNIKDHSVPTDGTNAGPALQALVNAVSAAGGGIITGDNCTLTFTSRVYWASNVHLDVRGVTLKATPTSPRILELDNLTNVTLRGFAIDGNVAAFTTSSPVDNCIVAYQCTFIEIANVRVFNTRKIAILFSRCANSGVENVHLNNTGRFYTISGNEGGPSSDAGEGIVFTDDSAAASISIGNYARNIYAQNCGLDAVSVAFQTSFLCDGVKAENFGGRQQADYAGVFYANTVKGLHVTNIQATNVSGNALDLVNIDGGVVSNIVVREVGGAAISLAAENGNTSARLTISNVNVVNCGKVTSGAIRSAITLVANGASSLVQICAIDNVVAQSTTGNMLYGVQTLGVNGASTGQITDIRIGMAMHIQGASVGAFSPGITLFILDTGKFTGFAPFNTSQDYEVNGTRVVGGRKSGWGTATGIASRAAFDTSTVTTAQLAQRLKALIDDLHATAGHGLIGT